MDYMERYADVRADVELLLAGARSIVVCAFSYRQASASPPGAAAATPQAHAPAPQHRASSISGMEAEPFIASAALQKNTPPPAAIL